MGTRHLIIVYYQGKYHIAKYGQWDGYPSGQGVTVLNFLQTPGNISKLENALINGMAYTPPEQELADMRNEMEREERARMNSPSYKPFGPTKPLPLYPSLNRDYSGEILDIVAKATSPVPIADALEFVHDTLFCEWAYVVDLDANMLEVYNGYGRIDTDPEPLNRFGQEKGDSRQGLIMAYHFDSLPSEEKFLADFKAKEEEEEEEEEEPAPVDVVTDGTAANDGASSAQNAADVQLPLEKE